jgi:hypothetical protein
MPYAALLESTAGDAVSSEHRWRRRRADTRRPSPAGRHSPQADSSRRWCGSAGLRSRGAGEADAPAQLADLRALLRQLGDALAAFHADLATQGHNGDVLTMTWSEFGRRIPENASEGTDHGTAAPMFLLGGGVAGGFYGEPASLEDLDDGNLKFTTDFRSVYASVLDRWIGVPSAEILGGAYAPIEGLLG